jgi:hypothetical protein
VFWLAVGIAFIGSAVIHGIAASAGMKLWGAVVLDVFLIASTGAMFALTVQREFAINSVIMVLTAVAILFWREEVIGITLAGLAASQLAILVVLHLQGGIRFRRNGRFKEGVSASPGILRSAIAWLKGRRARFSAAVKEAGRRPTQEALDPASTACACSRRLREQKTPDSRE